MKDFAKTIGSSGSESFPRDDLAVFRRDIVDNLFYKKGFQMKGKIKERFQERVGYFFEFHHRIWKEFTTSLLLTTTKIENK